MESIIPYCSSIINSEYSIYSALFIAGLISGFTHCAGMCGPFVIMQTNANMAYDSSEKISELARMKNSALLPYHLGRASTYIILASVAAYLSSHILALPQMRWFAAIMLLLSSAIFVSYALSKNKKSIFGFKLQLPRALENKIKPLFKNPRGFNGFILGSVLGLIPCGMIISAIFAVSSTGSVVTAATAMALFSLGTIPGLFSVSYGGNYLISKIKLNQFKEKFQSLVIFVSGIILFDTAIAIIF